ncbi:hypothetical protein BN1088_1431493 [Sphingobacterium sp. PM2-P1-29]|nr:hypothetical protein BN1088_1431493 [Sphingobacterium sp. PM2-P1-29]
MNLINPALSVNTYHIKLHLYEYQSRWGVYNPNKRANSENRKG